MYAEPNNESPLNTQAAALWANQEGTRVDISLRSRQQSRDRSISCSESRFVVFSLFRVQEDGGEALQARRVEEEDNTRRRCRLGFLKH